MGVFPNNLETSGRILYDGIDWSLYQVTEGKLKPLVRALQGPAIIERSGRITITRTLEEEMFRDADILSEGSCKTGTDGNDSYFGSTMVTFDLELVKRHWRGPFDDEARKRFADAVQGSIRIHLRAMRLAYTEVARRVSDKTLGTAQIETRIRLCGDNLYLDMDLDVPLGISTVLRK